MVNNDQIFISYAHEDFDRVRSLYEGLKRRQVNAWFDKEDLKAGEWKPQIEKAIARSRYFIICLSDSALRKTGEHPGFQDEELNTAYNIARQQAGGSFAIVPVRLEDCGRGDHRVSAYQQFDLFENWDSTLDRLALQLGGKSLSDSAARDQRSHLEKAIEESRSKAVAYYYAGDHDNALKVWESIAVLYGDSYDTWFGRGLNLDELGKHEDAVMAYQQALTMRSDSTSALNNLGVSLAMIRRDQEAIDLFDQVLSIDGKYALALFNKALSLKSLGREEDAIECLRLIREIDPEIIERHRASWGRFMDILFRTEQFRDFDDDDFPEGPIPT